MLLNPCLLKTETHRTTSPITSIRLSGGRNLV